MEYTTGQTLESLKLQLKNRGCNEWYNWKVLENVTNDMIRRTRSIIYMEDGCYRVCMIQLEEYYREYMMQNSRKCMTQLEETLEGLWDEGKYLRKCECRRCLHWRDYVLQTQQSLWKGETTCRYKFELAIKIFSWSYLQLSFPSGWSLVYFVRYYFEMQFQPI